ncbi:MAG: hypothetical protein OSJ60_16180 [Lachnospiraceae bacterium]|nr:hypothetical protein C819_02189 [Lachnospiraceae bacterium 10-1]MCX4353154.1 hypothetical protein [Lachnospiraceae bacterium]
MSRIFVIILNMSYTASIVILAVLLLRFFLKPAPRIFSYVLWLAAFLRLLCPIALHTDWGLIPAEKLVEIGDSKTFVWENDDGRLKGFKELYEVYNSYDLERINDTEGAENVWYKGKEYSLQKVNGFFKKAGGIWTGITVIWEIGVILLIVYGVASYFIFTLRLKKYGTNNVCEEETENNGFTVVMSDRIKTPFVAGALRPALLTVPVKPVIYLPKGLDRVQAKMIMEHEKMHIRRKDYLMKPIAYLALCLHWFNPLVWLAFYYMEQDMEISCDEAVLKKIGYDNNKEYARTLLAFSGQRDAKFGYPIGFGENSVKIRIKKAVEQKKTKKWVVITAAGVVAAAIILLLVNGNDTKQEPSVATEEASYTGQGEDYHNGVAGTDVNEETIVYLPNEKITTTEIAGETSQTTEHFYYAGQPGEENNLTDDGALEAAEGKTDYSEAEYIYEETNAVGIMKNSVLRVVGKYESFGLSGEIYENDYQLYFNGEPIRFFADNEYGWNSDNFSGVVLSRPASDENGRTGVMTQYDENGSVVGMIQLSEEELNNLLGD